MIINRKRYLVIVYAFVFITGCSGSHDMVMENKVKLKESINLILDTDFGPDYDDVGAITLMHALADSGEVNVLATIASTKYDHVAATLSAFNTYFGRPDLPVGVPKGIASTDRDWQHWSDTIIAKYPHPVKSNSDVMESIELYRKILSSRPDTSVTIVTIGFLTNTANLLQSGADQFSKLTGRELIKQKVKRLVCMAGAFPEGKEFNVFKDSASSKVTFNNWPTEIIFSGFEIGSKIKTGFPLIHNRTIRNSPVKDVFRISIPQAPEDSLGRMSWDQTTVLVAVRGAYPYYKLIEGRMIERSDGSNIWDFSGKNHFYLVEKIPSKQVEDLINRMMMHQPQKSIIIPNTNIPNQND